MAEDDGDDGGRDRDGSLRVTGPSKVAEPVGYAKNR